MKKRLISMLLCLVMLLSVFPALRIIAVDSNQWIYEFTLKLRNNSGAESNGSSVYGFIEFYGQDFDTELKFQIKKSGEVKRNSKTVITKTSNYAPWNIDWVGIRNTCDDAICVEYISARYAKNQSNPRWVTIVDKYNPKHDNEKWLETQKGSGYDVEFKKSVNIKRNLDSLGNFNDLGGRMVLDVGAYYGSSSNVTVQWNGQVSDQYGTYNSFNYSDTPKMTISANATTLNKSTVGWDALKSNNKITEIKSSDMLVGFSVNREKLLAYMNEKSINKIEIVTKLKFSTRGINRYSTIYKYLGGNSYGEITKTYTIIRNTFTISDISYYNTTKASDAYNYYYGKDAGEIRLQLQIKTDFNNTHLTKSMLSGCTVSFTKAGLQVGETGTVIQASRKNVTIDSYGRFNLYIPLSGNLDSLDVGSTLILEGGYIKIGGVTYRLCEERASFTPGNYSEFRIGQKYKIDTVSPTVGISNINEAINGWRKTISFTVTPSEDIYVSGTEGKMNVQFAQNVSPSGIVTKPYSIYRIDDDGATETGSTTLTAAAGGGFASNLTLALSENTETTGTLYLSGYDIAGNPMRQVLTNVRLDNAAPRVIFNKYYRERSVDGSKSAEFRFELIDSSETGKVYYCIVNGNNSPPSLTGNIAENTGTLDTTLGRWAFISQSKDMIDGTALVKCALGRNFNGSLYYFTEDAFGNRSNVTECEIEINNENTDCDITAVGCDMSMPQKNFNIVINSAEANTVYWRWRNSSSGTVIGDYTLYTSGTETGSGAQNDKNGLPVLLDGTWTLEVKIVTPSGRYNTFRRNFNFDNGNPGVTVKVSDPGEFMPGHIVTVKADDPSGISEAYADILYADGSNVPELETIALRIWSGGTVNEDICIYSLPSGAYKVKTVITDRNGFVTVKESAVFYIRTGIPELTLEIDSEKRYNDAPLFSAGTHYINIKATEAFAGIIDGIPEQRFYYNVSADSICGNLVYGGVMTPVEGGYKLVSGNGSDGITVSLPDALNEGKNVIYVYAAIVDENKDIKSIFYSAVAEIIIYYDDTAPGYTTELSDVHTSGSITGTVIAYDNFSNDITASSDSAIISEIVQSGEGDYKKYSFEISENGTHAVILTDAAGNRATVNITVTNIDRTAPSLRVVETPSAVVKGERTDYTSVIEITGHDSERVKFGFILDTDLPDAYEADGKTIKEEYFDYDYDSSRFTVARVSEQPDIYEGESVSLYTVTLTALTGNYYLAVYCEDSVGNGCYRLCDEPFAPRDAAPRIVSYSVSPKEAGTRAILTANFNVPVLILPFDRIRTVADMTEAEKLEADEAGIPYDVWIDEINFAAVEGFSSSFSRTYTPVITDTGKYVFYVTDETGRNARLELTLDGDDVVFGNDPAIDVKTYNYISDSAGGISQEEIPDGKYASAYPWYDEEGKSVSTRVSVTAEPGKYLFPCLYTAVDSDVVIDIDGLHFLDDDGMGINEESEWVELTDADGFTFNAYTKLVYSVFPITDDSGNALDRNERRLNVQYFSFTEGTNLSEVIFENIELIVDNIDNTGAVTGVYTSPSIEQNINGVPLYYTLGDVTAEITASDPHSGISKLYFYTYREGSNNFDFSFDFNSQLKDEYGNLLYEENGDPKIYLDAETLKRFEASNDYMYIAAFDVPGDENTKRIEIVFYKNFQGILTVSNGTGCETRVKTSAPEGFDIKSIFKKNLSADDYKLSYYYTDSAGNRVILPEGSAAESVYYKSITAVITPTASGTERGLYAVNNGGSFERKLDSGSRSFSFILSDKYGYTLDVDAVADNFDLIPGNVEYSLSTSEATNRDITVTITASDTQSGVGNVVLTRGGSGISLTQTGDIYTATLSENGNYTITMTDNAGNRRQKVFSVSNIDRTPPSLTERIYSFPQESGKHTSKDISVSLKFSEPGVIINKVERSSGSVGSYYVDFSGAVLRFTENMTLDVYFTDVCGNEAVESVSVVNIYKTPPAVVAKATVSTDKLSASVSFTLAVNGQTGVPIDTMRKLSDLYISFNGITMPADTASYVFNSNGIYTFRVSDNEGVASYVTVTVDGIDREAPTVTQIRWSYLYDMAQDGSWVENLTAAGSYTTGAEAGYVVGTDKFPATNRDVTVTVITDKPTAIIGKDGDYTTEHSIVYDGSGMYIFNLEKENGLSASYGVDIEVIDKTAPVIELVLPELIFFENSKANESLDAYGSYVAIGKNTVITNSDGSYTVSGMAEATSALTVDGGTSGIERGINGEFVYTGTLSGGVSSLTHTIKAVDAAGNTSVLTVYVINAASTELTGIKLKSNGIELNKNEYGEYVFEAEYGDELSLCAVGITSTGSEIMFYDDRISWDILYGNNLITLRKGDATPANTAAITAFGSGETAVKASLGLTEVETATRRISTGLDAYVIIKLKNSGNTTYKVKTPEPVTVNGITAKASVNPASGISAGTLVRVTVSLSGNAVQSGKHVIGLVNAFSASEITAPTQPELTVSAGSGVSKSFTFSFLMPAYSVNTLTITHDFTPREQTPNVLFTATGSSTGTLSGVSDGMKYKIGNGEWTDIDSGNDVELTGLSDVSIYIIKSGSATTSDSEQQIITVTKATKPNLKITQPLEIDGNGGVATTAEHEYRALTEWISATGYTELAPGTYYVRVKASGTVLASDEQEIIISAFDPEKEQIPSVLFTATGPSTGILSGVSSGMKYRIGNDEWIHINSENDIELTELSEVNIYIVKSGTETTADSEQQVIKVTKAAKPNLKITQPLVIDGNGSVSATAAHEYRALAEWIPATGLTELVPGTYYFRVKAAGTVLASDEQTITINAFVPGKEQMPSALFTATGSSTGILSGVSARMKYKIGNGEWIYIDSEDDIALSGLSETSIRIVKFGTSTTVDSDEQVIAVTKASTPELTVTQPSVVNGKGSISTTAAHEYRALTEWIPATGLTELVPGTYYFRVMADGAVLASDEQTVTIYSFEPGSDTEKYTFLSDASGVREDNGDMTFIVDGDHDKFTGITINGSPVGRNEFTDKSGSTVITLSASYLGKLSAGSYTMRIIFTDGYAETEFTVSDEGEKEPAFSLLWLWITLPSVIVAGGVIALYFIVIRKKKNRDNADGTSKPQ